MRVLHLIPALSGGGVLNVSINLTKAFAKLGHELYVIGPRNKELMKYANMFIETKAPLDLVSDPFYAYAYTLRNVNTVKSLTKEEKVDIILTHGPLVVLCMYEGINIPCFSVVHGTYGNEVRWMRYHPLRGFDKLRYMLSIALTYTHDMKLYSLATKKGLKLIAVSERTRQELIKNGTLGENVFSILNGVDIELFRPINREFARQYVEKKYGIRLDDFIIAHVGLGPIKGTHVLVKALAILKKRVKFTALFAGRLGPKSYREYIEKIVRELIVDDKSMPQPLLVAHINFPIFFA
ncbi:MAG: glycosyltransferase [Thermoproteus sp.]